MKDFYNAFYHAVEHSQAHHLFCEHVLGKDLCQHGFLDVCQLELLLSVLQLDSTRRVLDLGCGNGRIAENLSDITGAHVIGLNYIAQAIQQANARTASITGSA